MNIFVDKIDSFDNLGVMSEVEEDVLFFGEEVEDLVGDIKVELSSWFKCFFCDLVFIFE